MAEVSLERRFHGTASLAILHLRRLAKSNDVDAGFAAARQLRMIDERHEAFMRACLEIDRQLQASEQPAEPVTQQLIDELQACVLRINSADPA